MSTVGYLLSDTARLLRRDFDARVRQLGVTAAQARLLLLLAAGEGENQGHYAELLEVEPISLGRMLDRMEEAGLIERRKDPADRRAWRVHLTARSSALIEQVRVCIEQLEAAILGGFSASERNDFIALFAKLRPNLGAAATAPEPRPEPKPRIAANG